MSDSDNDEFRLVEYGYPGSCKSCGKKLFIYMKYMQFILDFHFMNIKRVLIFIVVLKNVLHIIS
jgi:hypothetical protein